MSKSKNDTNDNRLEAEISKIAYDTLLWDVQISDYIDKIPDQKLTKENIKKTIVHFNILVLADYLSNKYLDSKPDTTNKIEELIVKRRNMIAMSIK